MRTRDASKEQSIRQKALEMLVRVGLDGFSMQKLARAARVSPATLYIYFKDRDDLIFQLFKEEMDQMVAETLVGFDPEQSFAEGLKVQWRNRARYCLSHPRQSEFLEQVRHSPYYERFLPKLDPKFFEKMSLFVGNAIRRREMRPMPKEVYWSVAYAPLYQLVKFAQNGQGLPSRRAHKGTKKFILSDEILELALGLVTKALRP